MKTFQGQSSHRTSAVLKQTRSVRPNGLAQLAELGADSPKVSGLRQLAPENDVQEPNKTGLPVQLKTGIEALSGVNMDDVRVHPNSSEPGKVKAHAFAQGKDIHLAPGQEKHLAHEAWHVVQQAQGRVRSTTQLAGIAINDDPGLEREADVMGEKALRMGKDRF